MQKWVQKICAQAKEERDNPVESKIGTKITDQPYGTKHEWKKHHESEDHTEIEYYCDNCHIHKKEKQTFGYFKPKLLPHLLKSHGPAERHHDPQKYSAPETPVHLIGNIVQKNEIFNRCKNSKSVKLEAVNLEEKARILSKFIPTIILDECVASSKLLEKIQEMGYDVSFLGRELSDEEIHKKVLEIKGILVTEDKEFHQNVYRDKFSNDPIFVSRNSELVIQNLETIVKAMKRFES